MSAKAILSTDTIPLSSDILSSLKVGAFLLERLQKKYEIIGNREW
jgi:hypothetical protein